MTVTGSKLTAFRSGQHLSGTDALLLLWAWVSPRACRFCLLIRHSRPRLTDAGVPLATIGLLSELTLAYKFKFVWAPFLDQYDPPLIGQALGRRRGWLLVAILAVMAMLAGIALGNPGHWIWWTVGFSVRIR